MADSMLFWKLNQPNSNNIYSNNVIKIQKDKWQWKSGQDMEEFPAM
jgi:hypothetical protein